MNKNTKSVGRPSAQLVYPAGVFTIGALYNLNKGTVKWPLTIRQHIDKEVARRGVTRLAKTVKSGKVGQPAHQYAVTKFGQKRLVIVNVPTSGGTPTVEATPVTEVAISMEAPAPAVEVPVTVAETVSAAPAGWESIPSGTDQNAS